MSLRPRLADPRLLIAVSSAIGVLSVALVRLGRTSPGELAAVHGRLEELSGRNDCSSCHGGWTRTMGSACLDCHTPIEEQLDVGAGLHGSLGEVAVMRCATCHIEHNGPSFALVNARSFALAGVPERDAFDHARVGFEMAGKHLELGCVECHEQAEAAPLPEGSRRYLGLRQDCASCHEDPHEGRMERACADCHEQHDFRAPGFPDHDRHLRLVGGHAGLDCRACHAKEDGHALEAPARGRRPQPRACAACHESPHDAGFASAAAVLLRTSVAASCAECHEAEHESFRDERLALTPEVHARSGFALDAPHAEVACADCHDAALPEFRERHPGRLQDDCAACHADPHGGQFADGPFSQGCLACHAREAFAPHGFDLERHERTGLPLTGAHRALECAACHADPPAEEPRAFRGTPTRCERCHGDAHDGAFARFADELAGVEGGACARCHTTTGFDQRARRDFDHGRWTGFATLGAHVQAECESCHAPAERPDALGRRFGRVHERYGAVDGCASCHGDVHAGRFDGPEVPASVAGRAGCARCHEESSFRSLPHGFDHALWTGFPLDGPHGALDCSTCHLPQRDADGNVRLGRAVGAQCADCHASPHGGQFLVDGRTDCARCHAGAAASFVELVFDHDRDARFPLDAAHELVACTACHREVQDGAERRVRYRPLGVECADCHGDQKRSLRRKEKRPR